jgi:hypothetical protein
VVPGQLLEGEGWLVEEEAPGEVAVEEDQQEKQGRGTGEDWQGMSVGLEESLEEPKVPLEELELDLEQGMSD